LEDHFKSSLRVQSLVTDSGTWIIQR